MTISVVNIRKGRAREREGKREGNRKAKGKGEGEGVWTISSAPQQGPGGVPAANAL